MSNPASTAALEGLTAAFEECGEVVTFRGAALTVVIDRAAAPLGNEPGFVDLSDEELSKVAVLRSSVSSVPRAGEDFKDDGNKYHRIAKVRTFPHQWVCHCEVTA